MSWQQVKIQTTAEYSEILEEILLGFGAVSISFLDAQDQPLFQIEPGSTVIWDSTVLVALFDSEADLSHCIATTKKHEGVLNSRDLAIEILEDQDWERAWMADFKAMQFGDNLWICPSWQSPPNPNAVNIMLDPGLAFGSGTHATTSLCLSWLEQAQLKGKYVIDYGCGSGVLAIAAALLGAEKVLAIDNDPQAITATLDNSNRNNIQQPLLQASLPEGFDLTRADILLANILAAPLIELAPSLAALVSSQGQIVLSGILEDQADSVSKAYSQWFELQPAIVEDNWVRLEGCKK